jgi:5-formyltetrahydrofolate cyclo-ligase
MAEPSKAGARRAVNTRLKALPPGAFSGEGLRAAGILEQSSLWAGFTTLLVFLSLDCEIDTGPLIQAAFRGGKKIFVPRIRGKTLNFCRLEGPDSPRTAGPFGTREPASGAAELRPGDFPALAVTPGLAFTPGGIRLGRGGGYYDRFFAGLDRGILAPPGSPGPPFPCFALGLCLDCQIEDRLPSDKWDKPMDALCTGTGLLIINQPAAFRA